MSIAFILYSLGVMNSSSVSDIRAHYLITSLKKSRSVTMPTSLSWSATNKAPMFWSRIISIASPKSKLRGRTRTRTHELDECKD